MAGTRIYDRIRSFGGGVYCRLLARIGRNSTIGGHCFISDIAGMVRGGAQELRWRPVPACRSGGRERPLQELGGRAREIVLFSGA